MVCCRVDQRYDFQLADELAVQLQAYSSRYKNDHEIGARAVGRAARAAGYLTKAQLITLMKWKASRITHYARSTDHHYLRTVTQASFSSRNDRFRIESLTLLRGVNWPMASTILHFVFPSRYPVLDVRALWSLQVEVPSTYNYNLWKQYCVACRRLAKKHRMSLRSLDQALWQYSSENQRS